MKINEVLNVFGEEPMWFNAVTGSVYEPTEDHMGSILDDPDRFGVTYIDDEDPTQPFRVAYRNGWVRIKVTPKYNSAGIETDSLKKAQTAARWLLDNRPELFDLDFTVEIRDRNFKLDATSAEKFAKRGIVPRG